MARKALAGKRDQEASAFSAILMRFCEGTGARAAALVDGDGETVDYAGINEPFAIKVAAAELQLLLSLSEAAGCPIRELIVRARGKSYAALALSEGYALILQLGKGCFRISMRALSQALADLEREAGLKWAARNLHGFGKWLRMEVRTTSLSKRRPEAVWLDGAWQTVTVLGKFSANQLAQDEVGYLVRLAFGNEFTLVREPLGKWFAEGSF